MSFVQQCFYWRFITIFYIMENSNAHKDETKDYFSLKLQYSYISSSPRVIDENGHTIQLQEECQFTQLCRLCANVVDKATHLFTDNENGQNLADKINSCLPITVNKNDLLPKQLCSNCIEKLHECFQFSVACISAEKKLISQNTHYGKSVCINHIDEANECSNLCDTNYSCPLCVEGTLQVISNSISNITENDPDHTKVKADNISTYIVSNVHYNVSEEDVNINITSQITHHEDKYLTELCMGTDHPSQETIQDLNNFNLICRICNKFLYDIEIIHSHCKIHSKFNFFPCVLCENTYFINESQLEAHFSYNHPLLNCNSMKEDGHKEISHNELISSNTDVSNKNSLTDVNFFNQLNEESPSVKFNICSEILEGDSLLYNGYLMPDNKKMCEICGLQFTTDAMLLMHMNNAHISSGLESSNCSKYSESTISDQFVHKAQNAGKSFECELCGATFNQSIQLKKHKKQFHNENSTSEIQIFYLCGECKAVFPDFSQISEHSSIHEQSNINSLYVNNAFICEYCDLCFLGKEYLKQHLAQHVGELPYACLHCNLHFESYYRLSEHKKTHQNNLTDINNFSIPVYYLCEFCGRNFEQWQCLYIHRYKSHLHGRTFSNDENTKKKNGNSISPQDNSQTHLCEICGKIFESQSALTKHRKQEHPQTSKYQCSECGKVLANLTGLIIHRRLHTGEKPFVCDLCGKSFHQSSGMYTHRRTHTRECPYRCEYCGQAYNVKGDLDNHRRAKHTKERPFKCETCQKSFLTSSVFYQHRILHTGVRKYKCMYCEKSFARWNALRLHIRTHTGEKPYICYVCQRGFAQKGDMKKHMKTQHNVLEVPETT